MTDASMLSRKQVAQRLNISVRTLDRHRQAGRIAWINVALGKAKPLVRFRAEDVAAFECAQRIASDAAV